MAATGMRGGGLAVLAAAGALLAGCGEALPEDAQAVSVQRCERQFGRMAGGDAAKGAALCGCMVDRLAQEGMEITDAMGAGKQQVMAVTRSCARENGIDVAG